MPAPSVLIVAAAEGRSPRSGLGLALDTTATIYAAYLSDARGGAEVAIPLDWEL